MALEVNGSMCWQMRILVQHMMPLVTLRTTVRNSDAHHLQCNGTTQLNSDVHRVLMNQICATHKHNIRRTPRVTLRVDAKQHRHVQ